MCTAANVAEEEGYAMLHDMQTYQNEGESVLARSRVISHPGSQGARIGAPLTRSVACVSQEQFYEMGCDNCESFLRLKGDMEK